MAELIAQGSVWDFNAETISKYEANFKEGDKGKLIISLKSPIPDSVVRAIEIGLKDAGVTLWGKVTQTTSSPAELVIPFQKTMEPLTIAIIVIAALIAIYLLVSAWRIEKETGIPLLTSPIILPAIIIGVIILVIYMFLRR